jgi:hypothetical protein
MYHMKLPSRLFFTGVPGSRWSGIAQVLEQLDGFNTSDRTPERDYSHTGFTGHKGAYFGPSMEFDSVLDSVVLDSAWTTPGGTRIVKSHNWAYKLDQIKELFPNDWIMLVYRPDMPSYTWWHEAGGFNIKYPDYKWYNNSTVMMSEIATQNKKILEFAHKQDLTWHYFTPQWVEQNFKQQLEIKQSWTDILVTILK